MCPWICHWIYTWNKDTILTSPCSPSWNRLYRKRIKIKNKISGYNRNKSYGYMQRTSFDIHNNTVSVVVYLQMSVYKDTAGWHTVSSSHNETLSQGKRMVINNSDLPPSCDYPVLFLALQIIAWSGSVLRVGGWCKMNSSKDTRTYRAACQGCPVGQNNTQLLVIIMMSFFCRARLIPSSKKHTPSWPKIFIK